MQIFQIKKKLKLIFFIAIIISCLNLFLIYTSNNSVWTNRLHTIKNSDKPVIIFTNSTKSIFPINNETIPLESKSQSPFIFIGGYARSGTTLMVLVIFFHFIFKL